jgi:trehalose synthase
MKQVPIQYKDIESYRSVAGDDAVEELQELAAPLRGKRVVHVNATPAGGGVAEILKSEIPLLRSLGLDAQWWALEAPREFFAITKRMHNGLQGEELELSDDDWSLYQEWQERNAGDLPRADLIVIHDPQPMGLAALDGSRADAWVWRLHVDSSHPCVSLWERLSTQIDGYRQAVFTLDAFVPPGLPPGIARIVAPAIDPLTMKNRSLPLDRALQALAALGIDPGRPLMAQVARLDVWKDPWGVIDAYREVRNEIPGIQLALLGVIEAQDDPQAYDVYRDVRDHAADDPDIHIFIDPSVVAETEVAAVQTLAQVVFQKSKREGFGLTVAEALWKATPVVGGRAGGIPLQIKPGVGGYLVESVAEAADAALKLLADPPEAREIAARGRDLVRNEFLITRLIRDELAIYQEALDQ